MPLYFVSQQLMQEFQQVHRKMFTGTTTHAHHTTVVTQEHQVSNFYL
jgi:hypothetical protein